MIKRYLSLIGNDLVDSEQSFAITNPATEQVFAEAAVTSLLQIDQAVAVARQAFITWRHSAQHTRRALVLQFGELLQQHQEELALLLMQEQGKPLTAAREEVAICINACKQNAEIMIPEPVLQDDADQLVEIHYQPLGVVAIIVPWNYPLAIAIDKLTTTLMTGNTVIVKPSPFTPIATLRIAELIKTLFPTGVINIIAGEAAAGEYLVKHPGINKINFTGSVNVGKKIAAAAGIDLKRVTLELSANDAAIIFPDVDIDEVAEKIFWGAFTNNGQLCVAIKRLFVHEKIYSPLVTKLVVLAEKVLINEGSDINAQLGPVINAAHLQRLLDMIDEAKQRGAKILTGGKRLPRTGYFLAPTLISEVDDAARIVTEEQFGPVLPILSFRDEQEVIQRVNNTLMGLTASLWTKDLEYARQLATQIEAGYIWINQLFIVHPEAPLAGFKSSGVGCQGGRWKIEALMELQTVAVKRSL